MPPPSKFFCFRKIFWKRAKNCGNLAKKFGKEKVGGRDKPSGNLENFIYIHQIHSLSPSRMKVRQDPPAANGISGTQGGERPRNHVSYNIDRTIISLIGECLKDISIENSFGFVKELIAGPEFFLLNHSDIQPWQTLQKDIRLWRKKPILAYIKCRINGIPKYVKRFLYTLRITRPLADYIQYRLIERWG